MKHKTNVAKVTELMQFSEAGPLMQPFVIQAILFYAQHVLRDGVPMDDGHTIISAKAWHRCAQVAVQTLEPKIKSADVLQ